MKIIKLTKKEAIVGILGCIVFFALMFIGG